MNFEDCSQQVQDKIVVLRDKKGKSEFRLLNKSLTTLTKVQVDGCLDLEGVRCDWLLIIDEEQIEIYIELKGCRLEDAFKQLENTIAQISQHPKKSIKYCYVIITRSPLSSNQIQNQAKIFRKKYNAILQVKNSGYQEELSRIISSTIVK